MEYTIAIQRKHITPLTETMEFIRNKRLITAVYDNNLDEACAAIKDGADVNYIMIEEETYVDRFHGIYERFLDVYEDTPLRIAVREGYVDMVKLLLEKGANPSLKVDAVSPVHLAINFGEMEIACLLLKAGADASDIHYWEPYQYSEQVMKILAKHRMEKFKEDLMATAWHPNRIQRWIDINVIDMMIGC